MDKREYVRDTTHPPKRYGCIYVTCPWYTPNIRVQSNISYELQGRRVLLVPTTENGIGVRHHTDSHALYAVGGGNTGLASSVTTNFILYYLDKNYRREDTPGFGAAAGSLNVVSVSPANSRYFFQLFFKRECRSVRRRRRRNAIPTTTAQEEAGQALGPAACMVTHIARVLVPLHARYRKENLR